MIRTRFAPSPTGDLHLGGVRTALYSWLYARHCQGKFILRIEDTDIERSTEVSTQVILSGLRWLGLGWDEGPFYQKQRLEHYLAIAEQMVEKGLAYRCYCSRERIEQVRNIQLQLKEKPRYDRYCRSLELPHRDKPYVIRFKNPLSGEVSFNDQVLGNLTFRNEELDDLILVRSDRVPTYNFCVVLDDMEMAITHVIRGADHVNNTPRQINLYRALGAEPPIFTHLPLILGQDGKLLSKRHGATSILDYKNQGYLPEALLNYLVRLGWSHGDQEIFSLQEMIQAFDFKALNKAAAAFDPIKLNWLNSHYLKTLPVEDIGKALLPFMEERGLEIKQGPKLDDLILSLRARVRNLRELAEKGSCFYQEIEIKEGLLIKAHKPYLEAALVHLNKVSWDVTSLHEQIRFLAEKLQVKLGELAQPIRIAITGDTISPPLDETLYLVGREKSLMRLKKALEKISE